MTNKKNERIQKEEKYKRKIRDKTRKWEKRKVSIITMKERKNGKKEKKRHMKRMSK